MGGCVVSCMVSKDKGERIDDPVMKVAREIKSFSNETDAPAEAGFTKIRRSPSHVQMGSDAWISKFYGGEWGTCPALLQDTVKQYGDKTAMAWRPIKETKKEDVEGKPLEVTYLEDKKTLSYNQMWQRMKAFGGGLQALGLKAGDRIGIYEETSMEWMVACYGIWMAEMVGVTVYANLGDDALVYAMKESEVPAIICNGTKVRHLLELCKANAVTPPIIIHIGAHDPGLELGGATCVEFGAVLDQGAAAGEAMTVAKGGDPNTVALIMYTSGTTGDPKGVIMTHGNLIAAIQGFGIRLDTVLTLAPTEGADDSAYVAYLPLAHSLEFAAENVMLQRGITVGYGTPRTLTDKTARPHGDLKEYKPVFFVAVPRIYDTIKKAVQAKLPESGLKRDVFDAAYAERKAALENGQDTPYFNEKVFKAVRELLGGRVKAMASGAAPLSGQLQEFLEVVFGAHVMQGYGLTETCACCTIQRFGEHKYESIGGLISTAEVRLRDVPDTAWNSAATPPAGEIMIRGPVVTKGYFKQPEKTAEAYDDQGWFRTGDVGEFLADGTLKIVGRVKALAKNLNGEYIALEALESIYVLNRLVVPNGICILVNPQRAYIGAVIITDEDKAMSFAKEKKIEGTYPDILKDKNFLEAATKSLVDTAKANNRKPLEFVKSVRFFNDVWTPENGILTAAMKLKRREIDAKYADDITAIFVSE